MPINREWHARHKMPVNATLDQRIAWHIEHAEVCGCREIPTSVQSEINKRKVTKKHRPH
ncbi:MAG TPA: hypothetical protein VIN08_06440 [Ohtaekwangia sp.]|uniref:hypothetical protein n=1 Tax=Ohtaekwangia sp. TaxID=2066019 RepID=UPI002F924BD6